MNKFSRILYVVLIVLFFIGGAVNPAIKIMDLLRVSPLPENMDPGLLAFSDAVAWMGIVFLGPLQLASGIGFVLKKKWAFYTAMVFAGALILDMGIWILYDTLLGIVSPGTAFPLFLILEAAGICWFTVRNKETFPYRRASRTESERAEQRTAAPSDPPPIGG